MKLPKGWINRQITRLEYESKTWPEWMRREIELRTREQKDSAERTSYKAVDKSPTSTDH